MQRTGCRLLLIMGVTGCLFTGASAHADAPPLVEPIWLLAQADDGSPDAAQRMRRWQSLSPEKQRRLRKRYEQFRQLSPEEQDRMRQLRKKFRSLPAADQARLKRKWHELSPQQKRRFIKRRLRD